ncbi:MAG TPA: TIM barrel protein, partial [Thermoleophilaceae bacterium]|nr:TIM barrel protein [Thermoleophilaceae bacterium]
WLLRTPGWVVRTVSARPLANRRVAAAPISWGVCEVPGWGLQLPPERVLPEIAALGFEATELGPIGWLPLEPVALRARLDRHRLQLVGGFVPLVLHERDLAPARADAERIARVLAAAGAELFEAAVVMDAGWAPPAPLDDAAWGLLTDHLAQIHELVAGIGLELVLHPHAGTLVEREEEIERVLAATQVPLCLDTGHLSIAGVDPVVFTRRHGERVAHVHLKDIDFGLAERFRSGELTLVEATQKGLFRPLGHGDAAIAEVVELLERKGYERWLVLEQDTAITGEEPLVGRGPVLDVQASVAYLNELAPMTQEEVPQT